MSKLDGIASGQGHAQTFDELLSSLEQLRAKLAKLSARRRELVLAAAEGKQVGAAPPKIVALDEAGLWLLSDLRRWCASNAPELLKRFESLEIARLAKPRSRLLEEISVEVALADFVILLEELKRVRPKGQTPQYSKRDDQLHRVLRELRVDLHEDTNARVWQRFQPQLRTLGFKTYETARHALKRIRTFHGYPQSDSIA